MKDIVSAIRTICEPERGFEDLFDKNRGGALLASLCDDSRSVSLLSTLLYGRARASLIELIGDAYEYIKLSDPVIYNLMRDGLSVTDATEALEIFFTAFGFPGYRDRTSTPITEFVSYDKENYKCIHKGESRDGVEYGVGVRTNYYDGECCGFDECVWVCGRMIGYCHSFEVELLAFEENKYGFVVNDTFVGKYMVIGDDGEEGYMTGKPVPVC
jgi:hypothetical protein